jgi:hypothetical protein
MVGRKKGFDEGETDGNSLGRENGCDVGTIIG